MIWKDSSKYKDTHALCGGSKYSWRNYEDDDYIRAKINSYSATIGTLLHAYACKDIQKHWKIRKSDKYDVLRYLIVENNIPPYAINIDFLFPNLMQYVNDCIGFRMDPEVFLHYTDNEDFGGWADAISWESGCLKIFDLKTGVKPITEFTQLESYAAFFCLDYNVKPSDIREIEFRIYQGGDILIGKPDSSILYPIINKIISLSKGWKDFVGDKEVVR